MSKINLFLKYLLLFPLVSYQFSTHLFALVPDNIDKEKIKTTSCIDENLDISNLNSWKILVGDKKYIKLDFDLIDKDYHHFDQDQLYGKVNIIYLSNLNNNYDDKWFQRFQLLQDKINFAKINIIFIEVDSLSITAKKLREFSKKFENFTFLMGNQREIASLVNSLGLSFTPDYRKETTIKENNKIRYFAGKSLPIIFDCNLGVKYILQEHITNEELSNLFKKLQN